MATYQRKPMTVQAFQFTVAIRQALLAAAASDPNASVQGITVDQDPSTGQPRFWIHPAAADVPVLRVRVVLTNWIVNMPSGRRRVMGNSDFTDVFEVAP